MRSKVLFSEKYQVAVETEGVQLKLVSVSDSPINEALIVDLSAFLLNAEDKIMQERDFVFYNGVTESVDGEECPCSTDGSVVGFIRNKGLERLTVQLGQVANAVQTIAFVASIYFEEGQAIPAYRSFQGLCVELTDIQSGECFYRVYLSGDFTGASTLQFGSLVRRGTNWQWVSTPLLFTLGLQEATQRYAAAFC